MAKNEQVKHGNGRIRAIIKERYEIEDKRASVTDILADLRHYCDKNKLDFADCDRIAYGHYTEEK